MPLVHRRGISAEWREERGAVTTIRGLRNLVEYEPTQSIEPVRMCVRGQDRRGNRDTGSDVLRNPVDVLTSYQKSDVWAARHRKRLVTANFWSLRELRALRAVIREVE